jgi:hypothetical protein
MRERAKRQNAIAMVTAKAMKEAGSSSHLLEDMREQEAKRMTMQQAYKTGDEYAAHVPDVLPLPNTAHGASHFGLRVRLCVAGQKRANLRRNLIPSMCPQKSYGLCGVAVEVAVAASHVQNKSNEHGFAWLVGCLSHHTAVFTHL